MLSIQGSACHRLTELVLLQKFVRKRSPEECLDVVVQASENKVQIESTVIIFSVSDFVTGRFQAGVKLAPSYLDVLRCELQRFRAILHHCLDVGEAQAQKTRFQVERNFLFI